MIKLTKEQHEKYKNIFLDFKFFKNYIKFTFQDLEYEMYLDSFEKPQLAFLYTKPICFIYGNPQASNVNDLLEIVEKGSWIIPEHQGWNQIIESYFNNYEYYDRTFFDSSALNIEHVITLKKELPENLRIVPIEEKHITKGLIYGDVIRRFFVKSKFMDSGFGFALLDEFDTVHGFALTNYPQIGNEVELYFRVGLADYTIYREKGLGTILCAYFIEECLKRGIDPVWDAAHDISAHIGEKFGYIINDTWKMYHIL